MDKNVGILVAAAGVGGLFLLAKTKKSETIQVIATPMPPQGGWVAGSGEYPYGSFVTLVAHPHPLYTFNVWEGYIDEEYFYSYGNPVTIEALGDVYLLGRFSKIEG